MAVRTEQMLEKAHSIVGHGMLSMPNLSHSRFGKFDLSQARQKSLACNSNGRKIFVLFALNQFAHVEASQCGPLKEQTQPA
jgi:hypothetical protein